MRRRTLTEKILDAHSVGPAAPGSEYRRVAVDVVLGHEATIALLIDRFEAWGLRIAHPDRCLFAADHFVPPATAERASILQRYVDFAQARGVSPDLFFRGISHQLMLEDPRCVPGALVCGADSHTTMAGALGCFAAGFGTTDILSILATGEARLRVPVAVEVRVRGALPAGVLPKDLALWMMSHFGEGGATDRALEWIDEDLALPVGARATVSNMAVDCGATCAIWVPDAQTRAYLAQRPSWPGRVDASTPDAPQGASRAQLRVGRPRWLEAPSAAEVQSACVLDSEGYPAGGWMAPDPDAAYAERIRLDLSTLVPLAARPGSPADVVPASALAPERVHQVFIGSCTSGDGQDIRAAAAVLRGRRVAPGVRVVVTPASQAVYRALVQEGVVTDLIDAGAMVTVPSCGACGGIDKGILGAGEVCVSTSNRNFRGRMGHPEARVYLGSGLLAAAAALTGRVCDPRDVLPEWFQDQREGCRESRAPALSTAPQRSGSEFVREKPGLGSGSDSDPVQSGAVLSRTLTGTALVFGHDVNTDELHPSVFYSLDDARVRAGFLRHVQGHERSGDQDLTGRVVLAGRHFGIGSSRETGARVFRLAGISAVIAVSFARIFRQNLLNLGVPALACPALEALLPLPDGVEVRLCFEGRGGALEVGGARLELDPLDPWWMAVLEAGSLERCLGLEPASVTAGESV